MLLRRIKLLRRLVPLMVKHGALDRLCYRYQDKATGVKQS